MKDIYWNNYLYKEAVRILKKNGTNFDNMTTKEKNELIEMVMEDLDDKYRYE